MTQSEEIVTQEGVFNGNLESVFLYNQNMEVSYRNYINDRTKLEIRLSHPDASRYVTFQMIFVLQGAVRLSKSGAIETYSQIDQYQHNIYRTALKSSKMLVGADDDIICINISPEFIDRFLPSDHAAYQRLWFDDQSGAPFPLSEANMQISPEIAAVLQRLGNSSQSAFSDQLLLESKAIELFALQISQFEQLQTHNAGAKIKKLEVERMYQAREILIAQTGNQLSLRALAHLVGTNEFNLKRDFKAVFGKTVYAYLNQHKMEQAKSMLIEEDITVAETSKKMGYKHATHFTNAFKKYFGFLPNKIKTGKFSMLLFCEDFTAILENLNFLAI
ncbi:AraC family transcriptional regulator [Pedobacter agri]|uniref:helix-turn-helix domain-containing protein n=1 Tax=Pedobacter agri TaxID=454586 RepID=UPI002931C29B|nr:AraC family transcriptional regulator [Pedobacter agri]